MGGGSAERVGVHMAAEAAGMVEVAASVAEMTVAREVERNRPDSPCSCRNQGIWKPMVRCASHTTKGKAEVAAREGQVGGAVVHMVWLLVAAMVRAMVVVMAWAMVAATVVLMVLVMAE